MQTAIKAFASESAPEKRPVRLDQNENPYPLPTEVEQECNRRLSAALKSINKYPDELAVELCETAAKAYGVPSENVLPGNGGSSLLSLIFNTIACGRKAAMPYPDFVLNGELASRSCLTVHREPWKKPEYDLPVEELLNSGSEIIILCDPNNPTGTVSRPEDLENLLENFKGPVIIDEAYSDFCGKTSVPLLGKYNNLIILKTLSKGCSAAGLRIGFLLAASNIIQQFRLAQKPREMNMLAMAAAIAIMDNLDKFGKSLQAVSRQRMAAERELGNRGFKVLPSHANFVLAFTPEGTNGEFWTEELKKRNIYVCYYKNIPELSNAIRVSIGTPVQMNLFFKAIDTIKKLDTHNNLQVQNHLIPEELRI